MAIFGFLLIILGAMAILNEFFPIHFWYYFHLYWPLLFIVAALYRLIIRRKNDLLTWGVIFVFSLIQIQKLNIFHGNLWKVLFGIFIIYIGYQLISPGKRRSIYTFTTKKGYDNDFSFKESTRKYGKNSASQREVILDQDMLDESFSFQHKDVKIKSQTFSGGRIDLNFSDCRLNFLDTVPLNYITNLQCRLKASRLTIKVPDDWEVNFEDGRTAKTSVNQPNYILNIKDQSMASNIFID